MNPARSLGPTIAFSVYSDYVDDLIWKYHNYIYWVGPLAGTLFAALMYSFINQLKVFYLLPPLIRPWYIVIRSSQPIPYFKCTCISLQTLKQNEDWKKNIFINVAAAYVFSTETVL